MYLPLKTSGLVALVMLTAPMLAWAADPSSANFQNTNSGFAPAVFSANSPNYQVTGSVDSMTGSAQSPTYQVRSGSYAVEGAASTVVGGAVSGGGGGAVAGQSQVPTLEVRSPTFLSQQRVHGTYDPNNGQVFVNGSQEGIRLLSGSRWERDLPLFLGINIVRVHTRSADGKVSTAVQAEIERRLAGDINHDRRVDDADLSLFSRAWKRYTTDADFNEDGKIDDADLSLLAVNWGVSY